MKTFEETYKPYNFTENSTYIITVTINNSQYTNIQEKLPAYIRKVTGVFVSAHSTQKKQNFIGILSLCFNGKAFKSIRIPVQNAYFIKDCSIPFELNEDLKSNSFLQGYFTGANIRSSRAFAMISNILPARVKTNSKYTINIYIHYQP